MDHTESEINMTEQPPVNNLSARRVMEETVKATETLVSENYANSFHLQEDEATPTGAAANQGPQF